MSTVNPESFLSTIKFYLKYQQSSLKRDFILFSTLFRILFSILFRKILLRERFFDQSIL